MTVCTYGREYSERVATKRELQNGGEGDEGTGKGIPNTVVARDRDQRACVHTPTRRTNEQKRDGGNAAK